MSSHCQHCEGRKSDPPCLPRPSPILRLCASIVHLSIALSPTKEQEDADREAAFQSGVPHGYVPRGELYAGLPRMRLWVRSELHGDDEYGAGVGPDGRHRGGPFQIEVCMCACAARTIGAGADVNLH